MINKYITTSEFNQLFGTIYNRFKEAKLATKSDIADFITKTYFNEN